MASSTQPGPTTHPSLLIRLRDSQDDDAWRSFSHLYGPLIFSFLRRRSLQDQDAAEVMQESLLQISKSIQNFSYQPERGRFRAWVNCVVRSKLCEFYRKQQRQPRLQPLTLESVSASACEGVWNDVWMEHVVSAALARVQQRLQGPTWTAFRRVWLEFANPADVAGELDRDIAWIYLAKSRGLRMLREEVNYLADEPYDSHPIQEGDRNGMPIHVAAAE
jgi:RNA polymerase sigma factor (sigma-70 family)